MSFLDLGSWFLGEVEDAGLAARWTKAHAGLFGFNALLGAVRRTEPGPQDRRRTKNEGPRTRATSNRKRAKVIGYHRPGALQRRRGLRVIAR